MTIKLKTRKFPILYWIISCEQISDWSTENGQLAVIGCADSNHFMAAFTQIVRQHYTHCFVNQPARANGSIYWEEQQKHTLRLDNAHYRTE